MKRFGCLVGLLGFVLFMVGVARGKREPQAPQNYDPGPPVNWRTREQ